MPALSRKRHVARAVRPLVRRPAAHPAWPTSTPARAWICLHAVDDALGELALGLEGPGRAARFGDGILELRQHLGHVVGDGFLFAHRIQRHPNVVQQPDHRVGLAAHVFHRLAPPFDVDQFLVGRGEGSRQPFEVRPGLADGRALIGDRGDVVVAPPGDLVNRLDLLFHGFDDPIAVADARDPGVEARGQPIEGLDSRVHAGHGLFDSREIGAPLVHLLPAGRALLEE